ncbi:MAG: P-loop NTPase fold protein [Clostridia bacterium]|nr:P-loop NTPase fold protein [Clostridia bacterium]
MLGNTDKPLTKKQNDLFGIAPYIDGLSKFILNTDTPMTISIQGDWGSGKTSMMNMIREQISDKVHSVWFNTWQFSQFEVTSSMLHNLLTELDCGDEKLKRTIKLFGETAKTAVSALAEIGAGSGIIGDKVMGFLESRMSDDPVDEIKNLKNKFQQAVNAKLEKVKKDRLVIFVDDLDRLQPQKAVEFLEVLKLFLDCENCIFILAVDYEIVTKGIKQKFGNDVDDTKGKSFFDKIIQLPFKIPVSQYDINQFVTKMLKNMGISVSDTKDYIELIKLSAGCNPRSIKRLFNTYRLLAIMLLNKTKSITDDKTNLILFSVICMQSEYEKLYSYLVSCSGTLDSEMLKEISEDVQIISDATDISDEDELHKISNFANCINRILKEDDYEHLEMFKEILRFSKLTSVTADYEDETKSELDWKYRYKNKEICSIVNRIVNEKTGKEFPIWQPRKNKEWHKISDTYCGINDSCKDLSLKLEYSLKSDYAVGITAVSFWNFPVKPTSEEYFDTLLSAFFQENHFVKSGSSYELKLMKFSSFDEPQKVADKIAEAVIKNISAIEDYINNNIKECENHG